MKKKVISAATE